jgi:hypothetical protein
MVTCARHFVEELPGGRYAGVETVGLVQAFGVQHAHATGNWLLER